MKIEPIHELPVDEVDHIISLAKKFLEWNIEPRHCHLNALIDSIQASLIHFLPDDEDLINDTNDVSGATLIINTFSSEPHPLKEGLIALREIHNVINADGENFNSLRIKWAINDYLTSIKPFYLEEKLRSFQLTQSEKAQKPRARDGMTPQERAERNKRIMESYARTDLKLNSFAINEARKQKLSPSTIKKIIKSQVDT